MTLRAVFLMLLVPTSALAQPGPAGVIDVPPAPPAIAVPAGHVPFLLAAATGTQNYVCLASGGSMSWRFVGPQATLFLNLRSGQPHQITTHFLSANPGEGGVSRPTWQHSVDTSRIWGRLVTASTDPAYVEPGAIAWLLLEVSGAEPGPAGGSYLTQATFIQRVRTSGGAAPAGGCSAAADVGTLALVPYTTDYVFYRAERPGPPFGVLRP